jgi:hypothetical protein
MRRIRFGTFALAITTLVLSGCGSASVGYRVDNRIKSPVSYGISDPDLFFVRSVDVECHAAGYEADFAKAAVAGVTPERLNRFLVTECPSCFSDRGKYALDLLVGLDFKQNTRDTLMWLNVVSLWTIPLPVSVVNQVTVDCVALQGGRREVLFSCDQAITFEMKGWTSPWPTGCIPCPFETDTEKETLGPKQSVLGQYSESANNLLAEQVSRRLTETLGRLGLENVKRKLVLKTIQPISGS